MREHRLRQTRLRNGLKTAGRFDLSTDKARYAPGESVRFTCSADPGKGLFVRYRHLAETVGEEPLTAAAWTWNPPTGDFKGYLVEVVSRQSGRESVVASTAVDYRATGPASRATDSYRHTGPSGSKR